MSHGIHMNASWHILNTSHTWHIHAIFGVHVYDTVCILQWVMAHVWMRHGTYMNESWHVYDISHVWHIRALFWVHMYDTVCILRWVMAHIWTSHGTHDIFTRYSEYISTILFAYCEMSHGTYMITSWHILNISHTWHIHALFRVHIQNIFLYMTMSHGAHTYEWVMAYLWHIHALFSVYIQDIICVWRWDMANIHTYIHMNEWWHIYDIFTRCVEYMYKIWFAYDDESWHTHIWKSDGTYMTYSRVFRITYVRYVFACDDEPRHTCIHMN